MRRQRQPQRPDPEEQARRQQEHAQQSAGLNTATQVAGQHAPDLSELQSKEFIETAFEPDVNRGDDVPGYEDNRIEQMFAAEFGRHAGLGNITREEWQRRQKLNKAKALLALQEFARPSGLGSRCRPDLRQAWADRDEPLPARDDDTAREITAAFEEKTNLESLSQNAKGFDGLTQVTAVTYSKSDRSDSSSGGTLERLTGGLFGG